MSFSPVNPGGSLAFGEKLASPRLGRVGLSVLGLPGDRGWPSRDYRPHWAEGLDNVRAITLRLCDALPGGGRSVPRSPSIYDAIRVGHPPPPRSVEASQRIDQLLDAGGGRCWLARPEIAELVESTLLHFDPGRYRLLAWCIMPNHVHALIEIRRGITMDSIVRAWKSYTAIRANKLLGRNGNFWQRNHMTQPVPHASRCRELIDHIETNPSRAGLVERRTDWNWSSARFRPTPAAVR